jgi:hypothetical protein
VQSAAPAFVLRDEKGESYASRVSKAICLKPWDNLNSVSLEGRRWPPLKLGVKRSD